MVTVTVPGCIITHGNGRPSQGHKSSFLDFDISWLSCLHWRDSVSSTRLGFLNSKVKVQCHVKVTVKGLRSQMEMRWLVKTINVICLHGFKITRNKCSIWRDSGSHAISRFSVKVQGHMKKNGLCSAFCNLDVPHCKLFLVLICLLTCLLFLPEKLLVLFLAI